MLKVNLAEKLAAIQEQWSPRIVGEINEMHVKVVKLQGEFIWHVHADQDEMFLVLDGRLDMHFRDRIEPVGPGEFIIVPRGVEHKPVCEAETQVVLVEPRETVNTGDGEPTERTKEAIWAD